MNKNSTMTISDLARLSGVPSSTIRYYLREGLIAQPLRKGKTRAYYNNEHISQLKKLKKLRNKTKLSIKEIKHVQGVFTKTLEGSKNELTITIERKNDIVEAATRLFRSKGFSNTSMDDIAEQAKISHTTFYKYFNNKEELFFECADKVFYNIDNDFRELNSEMDIIERFRLRAYLFIKTHSYMIDMLNILRGTYTMSDRYMQKLDSIIKSLTVPLQQDLDEGIRQGIIKKINTEVVAYILMGAAEYIVYYLNGKNEKEINDFIDESLNLIYEGANPIKK